jgi:branched-chain amino acid transport system ATP-binding protein
MSQPMLVVDGLTKSFGGLTAIDDVSFTVARGEFVGIIGPNGAGKTTLMNLITGHLRPDTGSMQLEGQSLGGLSPFRMCRLGIGRTFQIVRPFPEMSVEDNVITGALFSTKPSVGLKDARAAAREPLELTGLYAKRHVLAGSLTLGEKKKLELARALATKPKLLLLDEVMGGVSRADVHDLMEVLRRIHASGMTIVMIEHLVEVILALAERVVVLNFGKKLVDGAPQYVVEHPDVVESYLGRPLEVEAS